MSPGMLLAVFLATGGAAPANNASARFSDATSHSGIRFQHQHGGSGDKHIVETIGGGGGLWDYDEDGDLDVYLLNGAPLPGWTGPGSFENALYRNEGGRFVDVTGSAGLAETGYSMGCAMADYDNDGDTDLFVASFGPDRLYRNNGDGTFTDATVEAGLGNHSFAASAAFADIDGDGHLDLYVTSYLDYELDEPIYCGDRVRGIRTYCHPDNYGGASDLMYRNRGDGSFEDVSVPSGVRLGSGKGLGVAASDYDGDGDTDFYVANDSVMNFLFVNQNKGSFREEALARGVGFNEDGRPEAGMGVDFGDYDGDGRLDLFVTNYEQETNTLYRNLGDGTFSDVSYAAGLGLPSLPWVGFGTNFFDADNDGDQDVFVANGHIMDRDELLSDATSYRQPNQLYENRGGHFEDISASAGEHFSELKASRGTAFGDWDNDGDVDLLVLNNNDTPALLQNDTDNGNRWLLLRFVGRKSNRDGIGVAIRARTGESILVDELRSGTSYLSQNDLRLHLGLGEASAVRRLQVRWPSGDVQSFDDVGAGRLVVLVEGKDSVALPLELR